MKIPFQLVAGEMVTWDDDAFRDNLGNSIDSGTWTLNYVFKGATALSLTGTSNGSGWLTSMTSVQSAALSPGIYYWQSYVTNGSNRINLSQGQLEIKQDLSAAGATVPYDGRTQSEKDLDSVQAAIRAMITNSAVQEYTIGGRSVRKMSLSDLQALESRLKYRINRERKAERIANGLGNPSNVMVRFTK